MLTVVGCGMKHNHVCCAGNTERLLEMLHGSDGWEKLVSELQQKEAEGEKAQPAATEGGQKVAGRKRGRKGDLLADTRYRTGKV